MSPMISYIAMCISMDETTTFSGYLQTTKGCIGITESVQLGTKKCHNSVLPSRQ